jgi:hypothetical protein
MNKKIRTFIPLSPARRDRLAACSAAAVGALTLSSAESAIVYINLNNQAYLDNVPADGTSTFHFVDINTDGATDLILRTRFETTSSTGNLAAIYGPVGGVLGVVGSVVGNYRYPARLTLNASIGASAALLNLTSQAPGSLAFGAGYPNSKWAGGAPGNTGFMGIRFTISGNEHFGWVRMTVVPQGSAQARSFILHEAAYESVPNANIKMGAVPEPSSLGLLALGSAGILAHRRRRGQVSGGESAAEAD